jgi:hypothetical protein
MNPPGGRCWRLKVRKSDHERYSSDVRHLVRAPAWFVSNFALRGVTAVLQLRYTETHAAKWIFPQEKATFYDPGKGIFIGEPL